MTTTQTRWHDEGRGDQKFAARSFGDTQAGLNADFTATTEFWMWTISQLPPKLSRIVSNAYPLCRIVAL
jgi:hypothetical protein